LDKQPVISFVTSCRVRLSFDLIIMRTFTGLMSDTKHKHTILYAEDDHDDVFMVRQAFEKFDDDVNLLHAADGYEAIEKLKWTKNQGSVPCLVILDINMPGMDGRETLVNIKQQEGFNKIPVVLFTTSSSDLDRAFAQKWGAEFVTKPLVYSELEMLAKKFLNICSSAVANTEI
jgi:CheY-like chemotaxis protein